MILAIDVGGTKTLIALFNHEGRILRKQLLETPSDYNLFKDRLIAALRAFWEPGIEIEAIGLAVPGLVDYKTGFVTKFGNLDWKNVDIKDQLQHDFNVPVFIDNDANVGALFEANQLDPTPQLAVYVTIGTGIGTGIIFNGKIDQSIAKSEGGHIVLRHHDQYVVWEDIASGRAIRRDYQKYAYEIDDKAVWDDIARRIALGLFSIIPLLQPDAVIIGGGIGTHFAKYKDTLNQELAQNLPHMVDMPHITAATHSEEAVVYGCNILARQSLPAHANPA